MLPSIYGILYYVNNKNHVQKEITSFCDSSLVLIIAVIKRWPCRGWGAELVLNSYRCCLNAKVCLCPCLDIPASFKITCMSSWNTGDYLMAWQICQQTTMCLKAAKLWIGNEHQRFLLHTKLISSGSVIIEPVYWLCHSVHSFTSRPGQLLWVSASNRC